MSKQARVLVSLGRNSRSKTSLVGQGRNSLADRNLHPTVHKSKQRSFSTTTMKTAFILLTGLDYSFVDAQCPGKTCITYTPAGPALVCCGRRDLIVGTDNPSNDRTTPVLYHGLNTHTVLDFVLWEPTSFTNKRQLDTSDAYLKFCEIVQVKPN